MRYLYTLLLTLFSGSYICLFAHPPKKGDDQNYLEVTTQGSLNFVINSADDFENKQTVYNAIHLKFKTKDDDCFMFVKVSNYTVPSGASKSTIPLEIELKSNDAKKLKSVVNGSVQLTTTDRQLFSVDKGNSINNFYYDLSLQPLGYTYPEGQYNFTITFTMTQP